ncbi:DUF6454 family protein [Roseomonas elaeocarpi]|uniref:DUF6454 family protein n=1 Tax=Roseomonas elaeocarpi TaxID=907779 RepID=A0ABV6JQE3_9PROT
MRSLFRSLLLGCAALAASGVAARAEDDLSAPFLKLTRAAAWRPVATIPLDFPTFHPQGLARVGDRFLLSSVDIQERPQSFGALRDGMDRSAGRGQGHVFEVDGQGHLLRDLKLGEGDIYHPGGMDFDGTFLWVPVAEYRPNSHSIIYRVDPRSMQAEEMFRVPDHVGGLVMDRASGTLHGVSWGSRRFYSWKLDAAGHPAGAAEPPRENPSFYVDYQDCHAAAAGRMLCGGLNVYRPAGQNGPALALGGLDLVDLARGTPLRQLPVELWTESGLPMTQNPFAAAPEGNGMRFWFAPEDDRTRIYVFDAVPR